MPTLIDSAIIAAIVSAAVTALGWIASHWSENRLDTRRRIEKITDFQTALIAEITSNLDRFADVDFERHKNDMIDRIAASGGESGYTPFVPRYAATFIFDEILKEIYILPNRTIDAVVEYYKFEYRLYELVEDLRSDRYAKLDAPRKADIYSDYVWLIEQTRTRGEKTLVNLRTSLREGSVS